MFTKTDYINLLNLLKRVKYDGLEEAEVAVALATKLKLAINPVVISETADILPVE